MGFTFCCANMFEVLGIKWLESKAIAIGKNALAGKMVTLISRVFE